MGSSFLVQDPELGSGHVVLRCGANKTEASCLRKVHADYRSDPASYPTNPRSVYLFDLVRAEAWFADPYVMAAFLEVLDRAFEITRIKPKYFDSSDDTQNCILVNVSVGSMVCEVQCLLYEHALLKRLMHKMYEIVRAPSIAHCLVPLWDINEFESLRQISQLLDIPI